MFGGAVPDALTALVRLLASLHDDDGEVAVAGLKSGVAADLDYDEDRLREESGLLDGVSTIGTGLAALADLDQAVDHDHRHRRTVGRDLVEHAGAERRRRRSRCGWRPTSTTSRPSSCFAPTSLEHAPWGAQVEVTLDDRGLGLRRRRTGARLRPGPSGLPRRVGRRAGRHRGRRVDPVRRRVRRAVPGCRDPRHRRRGPRRASARCQRVAAPGRVREGLRRRGPAPGASRRAAGLNHRARRECGSGGPGDRFPHSPRCS